MTNLTSSTKTNHLRLELIVESKVSESHKSHADRLKKMKTNQMQSRSEKNMDSGWH